MDGRLLELPPWGEKTVPLPDEVDAPGGGRGVRLKMMGTINIILSSINRI